MKLLGKLSLLVLLVGLVTVSSYADTIETITAGGIKFTADLSLNATNHTFTLDFEGLNTSSNTATLNYFTLQFLGNGNNASFSLATQPSVSNWTFLAGYHGDNSGVGCNKNDNGSKGDLCGTASSTSHALTLAPGADFDWTFTGSYGTQTVALDEFHLQANGEDVINGRDHKWAVSDDMEKECTPPPPPATTPEPASLFLLGSGLSALALKLRRK